MAKVTGQIRVSFWRTEETGSCLALPVPDDPGLTNEAPSLYWKALKGSLLHHAATVAPAIVTSQSHKWSYTREVDSKQLPFAVFIFNYRSERGLQEELIIPRPRTTSTSTATACDSPVDTHKQLYFRAMAAITAQNQGTPMDSDKFAQLYTVAIVDGKEVIDLTDDFKEMEMEDSDVVDLTKNVEEMEREASVSETLGSDESTWLD